MSWADDKRRFLDTLAANQEAKDKEDAVWRKWAASRTLSEVTYSDCPSWVKGWKSGQIMHGEDHYELEDWAIEPAKDSAEYLEGPVPTKMKKLTDQEIDREMVKALNQMEGAMEILETLRKSAGDYGPKMGKGEAELWKAYNIISAKRPI